MLTAQLLRVPLTNLSEIPKAAEEEDWEQPQEGGELTSDCHEPEEEEDCDQRLLDTGAPDAGDQANNESLAPSVSATSSAVPGKRNSFSLD